MRLGRYQPHRFSIDIMRSIRSFIFTFIYKLFITSFVVLYKADFQTGLIYDAVYILC